MKVGMHHLYLTVLLQATLSLETVVNSMLILKKRRKREIVSLGVSAGLFLVPYHTIYGELW